jgi:hypothetical protein
MGMYAYTCVLVLMDFGLPGAIPVLGNAHTSFSTFQSDVPGLEAGVLSVFAESGVHVCSRRGSQ